MSGAIAEFHRAVGVLLAEKGPFNANVAGLGYEVTGFTLEHGNAGLVGLEDHWG